MATLKNTIEDLRVLLLDPPWDEFYRLLGMLDSMDQSPELEVLTNDELRAFKGLRLTLHKSTTMEPGAMQQHVGAHWMGAADQAVRKLSIGPRAVDCVTKLMQFPSDAVPHEAVL